jgi:hypothetical protein
MDIRTFFQYRQKSHIDSKKNDNDNSITVRSRIKSTKIKRNGVEYFITTNADIQDKIIKRFIDSLIANKETDEEDLFEERDSLRRILVACTIVSDEITQLTSSLKSRLNRLDRL